MKTKNKKTTTDKKIISKTTKPTAAKTVSKKITSKPASKTTKPTAAKTVSKKITSKPASKKTASKALAAKTASKSIAVKQNLSIISSKTECTPDKSCTPECTKHCGCKFLEYLGFLRLSPRLNRMKYLILHIFWTVISVLLFYSLSNFNLNAEISTNTFEFISTSDLSIYQTLVLCLAFPLIFVNNIFMTIRRLNDFDLKGWWILLTLVPFIGIFWYIAIFCIPGTKGKNRFGECSPAIKCN